MRDQTKTVKRWGRFRISSGAVSIAAHGLLFLLAVGFFHRAPKIAPYKLPGTAHGVQLLTYYAAGSREQAASEPVSKVADKPKIPSVTRMVTADAKPEKAVAPITERGAGKAAQSGFGDGEISMALLTYFPHPKPDLSSLAHGTQGDVILNAVIDEHGKISELTLLKGLGKPVDDQVIAAVREWTYSPAKKNGTPVPSEQELHFHYERGQGRASNPDFTCAGPASGDCLQTGRELQFEGRQEHTCQMNFRLAHLHFMAMCTRMCRGLVSGRGAGLIR